MRGFAIAADGSLEPLAGSPFSYDFSRPWSVEISSTGDRVYVLDLDAGLAVFELRADGALDLVPGSPFPVGGFTEFLVLAEDDRTLYVPRTFDSEIVALQVDPFGVPSELPGSPFPGPLIPAALVAPAHTNLLLVASVFPGDVESFGIEASGVLSPLGGPNPVSDPEGRLPNGAVFRSAPLLTTKVRIDIKPGSDTNPVQPKSHGLIPVALFGSASLSVQDIDWATVRFGPGKAAPWRIPRDPKDGDGDGQVDTVVHFRTQETGLGCVDESATLTGETVNGRPFEASDVVQILGCD